MLWWVPTYFRVCLYYQFAFGFRFKGKIQRLTLDGNVLFGTDIASWHRQRRKLTLLKGFRTQDLRFRGRFHSKRTQPSSVWSLVASTSVQNTYQYDYISEAPASLTWCVIMMLDHGISQRAIARLPRIQVSDIIHNNSYSGKFLFLIMVIHKTCMRHLFSKELCLKYYHTID